MNKDVLEKLVEEWNGYSEAAAFYSAVARYEQATVCRNKQTAVGDLINKWFGGTSVNYGASGSGKIFGVVFNYGKAEVRI